MLLGQYEGKLSEKQQISLPSKLRQILGDRLVITKGFEQCLVVVAEKDWKTLLEGTEGKPFTDRATRDVQRFLLGNASFVELDNKGRCVLPAHLRLHAQLHEDIIYAGIQRFIEVWDKKMWEEQQQRLSKEVSSIAERLSGQEGGNE